jgi:hypothetical protein
MPRNTEIPTQPASPDWRAEAECRGAAAFENAVAEPAIPPEQLDWLWRKFFGGEGTTMQNEKTKQNVTRRSIFAGLMGLPAVAVAANAATSATTTGKASNWLPDVLHQSDLQSVFDDLELIGLRILEYRRRLLAGAVVEPGPLVCEFELGGPRAEKPHVTKWGNFGTFDIDIVPVEHSFGEILGADGEAAARARAVAKRRAASLAS